MKKSKKYIFVVLVIALILIVYLCYNFLINPRDLYGNRCTTYYNKESFLLKNGETIDIPKNSCYVNECCSHVANFRSKASYNNLEKELNDLERKLNEKYKDMHFEIELSDKKLYREYSIKYYYK